MAQGVSTYMTTYSQANDDLPYVPSNVAHAMSSEILSSSREVFKPDFLLLGAELASSDCGNSSEILHSEQSWEPL